MKLWQAMLEGAKMGRQLFNKQRDGNGGSCAMGAVYLGLGGVLQESIFDDIYAVSNLKFPELAGAASCPEGKCKTFTCGNLTMRFPPRILDSVIVHLNNDHRWSRQRIAEWLANRELNFKPSNTTVKETV